MEEEGNKIREIEDVKWGKYRLRLVYLLQVTLETMKTNSYSRVHYSINIRGIGDNFPLFGIY